MACAHSTARVVTCVQCNTDKYDALRANATAAAEQLEAMRRHYDAAAPEHNLLALLDLYEERQRGAEHERDALLGQLEAMTKRSEAAEAAQALHLAAHRNQESADAYRIEVLEDEQKRLHACAQAAERERDELSDRLDAVTLEHDVTKGYRQHAERERDELRAEVERLREVLRSVEWSGCHSEHCPSCKFLREVDHGVDCRLAAALRTPTPQVDQQDLREE